MLSLVKAQQQHLQKLARNPNIACEKMTAGRKRGWRRWGEEVKWPGVAGRGKDEKEL